MYADVGERTGCRAGDCRRQTDGAALGDDDAVRTGGLRGTDDRAEVVRVLDAVADDDERRFAALLRDAEDVVERDIFLRGGLRDNALMRAGDAHVIELAAVAGHGRYAVLFRLGGDVCEMRALSEEDLVYRASRAQSLEDSVAALDQRAVILLRRAAAVLFICHIFIHSMFDADILR